MSYSVNEAGVELIASFEGFVDGVYNDVEGYATVGYGHLLHYSNATPEDHRVWDGRGHAFYLSLLHQDINRLCVEPLAAFVHVPLNQNQVNALASAIYNCGAGFIEGTVGRLLNERRYFAAANAFLLWDHPEVLRPRRETERALFLRTPVERLPWLEQYERRTVLEYERLVWHPSRGRAARAAELSRIRVLRRLMLGYAHLILRAVARDHKWDVAFRRQRYRSLMARAV